MREPRELRGVSGDAHDDFVGGNRSLRSLHTARTTSCDVESRDLAVLNDVDAEGARTARVAPHHSIVPADAGSTLDEAPKNGTAPVEVERGSQARNLLAAQHFRGDSVHADGVAPAPQHFHLVLAVAEVQDPSLAQHDVEVELAPESLVELECVIVEGGARGIEIVGSHHLRVAPRIAAPDPPAIEHRDVAHAVLFSE